MPHIQFLAANGQQTLAMPAGFGVRQIVPLFGVMPSAGTMQIEARASKQSPWQPVAVAHPVSLTNPAPVYSYGEVSDLRITIAGLSGGQNGYLLVSDGVGASPIPTEAFTGLRAMCVQPYTEANVKNGLQFYLRAVWPNAESIPTTETRKVWFKTGAKLVIAKLRDVQYVAEELRIRLFANPTGVTGGTALGISNYNGVSPVATTCQAKKNVTTTSDGTEFGGGDPEYFFGATTQGNRTTASIPSGRERILPPNTEFIVSVENTGSGVARCQYFLDFYEGSTDLPL